MMLQPLTSDWPAQQMPAFDAAALADSAIDTVFAYLRYLTTRPK